MAIMAGWRFLAALSRRDHQIVIAGMNTPDICHFTGAAICGILLEHERSQRAHNALGAPGVWPAIVRFSAHHSLWNAGY